ncbi:MAG: trehalose-6-phosphate synthase [Archangium sp.]
MEVVLRRARFLILLVGGLGVLALAGDVVLTRTTRAWFERDVTLRTQLAFAAGEKGLANAWGDPMLLKGVLDDITRDERIVGTSACTEDGTMLAHTPNFPLEFDCTYLQRVMWTDGEWSDGTWTWTNGTLHLGARQIGSHGFVVLVHDLSFLGRREATTRQMLVVAFFLLALAASVITIFAARFAWRDWTYELRRALTGEAPHEFQPLLRDVRGLVDRLTSEQNLESRGGPWSANRLKAALATHLQGERVVILANREPYIHDKSADGIRVLHPASGLVTALEPVMRACSGVWVAHGAGTADRETVDAHDRVRVPPGEESYQVRRVWLTPEEEAGYYYGFSNEGLWPLCHLAHARPMFRASDWAHYERINRRFADAVCSEVDSDEPIILVQDYHFALAPQMIRERLPRATILTFWHIPWPNAERFGICPWRDRLLEGLLGSSIVGFHTQQHCNNFIDSVDAYLESRIDRETRAVVQKARATLVRPYPISIEWPVRWLADAPSIEECRRSVREELKLAPDALIGVGIDRLDYTKGIEERLAAVDELLTRHPEYRGRFTFVQLAAPSRTKIPRYQELNDRIEAVAAEINAKWSNGTYRPIALLRAHHEPPTVFRYFRAAELCYVSSLHDGMNLVAKEYVAAHDDELGVLVLSQFTGAARDLSEALIVNPYDLEQSAEAMAVALSMPLEEQRERMRSMRRLVSEFNVYRWAGRMLVDAAELRRRERISGRFPLHQFRSAPS